RARGPRASLGPRGRDAPARRPRGDPMTTTSLIALGGYSRSGSGRGPGVELLALDGERALAGEDPAVRRLWSADLPDPSFVLWNREGTLLHAVLETDPTRVATLRVAPDGSSAELV